MIWIEFALSAAIIALAATKLATYAEAIGEHTRLGGMFVGTLLLGATTSLPELLTAVNAIKQGVPHLTIGDLFGSNMANMLILAVLGIVYHRVRILRRVALSHAVSASLAVLLASMAVFFILADLDARFVWVGLDSLLLIIVYVFGMRVIRAGMRHLSWPTSTPPEPEPADVELPSLRHAVTGFVITAAILILAAPRLVHGATGIARVTGLGAGVVGVVFVGVVTSLPEVVTVVSAGRIGAYDLAVGNLFGSNVFNVLMLGIADVLYTQGRLLDQVNPSLTLAGLLGLMLTSLAGLGNLARVERRILFVELDALAIIVTYALGMWVLVTKQVIG